MRSSESNLTNAFQDTAGFSSYWSKWVQRQRIKLTHNERAMKTYSENCMGRGSGEEIGWLMQSKPSL